MGSVRRRSAIGFAVATVGALSLLVAGTAEAGGPQQKPPQATTVTSKEKRLAPGKTETFIVECPRGYVLTDLNFKAVTSLGGSDRSDPKLWGLRVNKEYVGLDTAIVDITNNGNENLLVFAYGRCVRKVVRFNAPVRPGARGRPMYKPFLVWLKEVSVEEQKGAAGGMQQNDCGQGRLAIGQGLGNLAAFHPLSVLATVIIVRRFTRWVLGQRNPSLQELSEVLAYRSLCARLRAGVARAGANKRRRKAGARGQSAQSSAAPRARIVVRQVHRNRKVPSHSDPNQTSRIAVACPRRFTATSYGWDARGSDAGPVPVKLRRSLYPSRRKVAVAVTNTSGATHTVRLTAICLTFRFRR